MVGVFGGCVAVGGTVGAGVVGEAAPDVAVTGGISAVGGCSGMRIAVLVGVGPDAGDGAGDGGDDVPGLSCPAAPGDAAVVGGDCAVAGGDGWLVTGVSAATPRAVKSSTMKKKPPTPLRRTHRRNCRTR